MRLSHRETDPYKHPISKKTVKKMKTKFTLIQEAIF